MEAKRRLSILVGAAIVVIAVAIQVRSAIASAAARPELQTAWGQQFRSEEEASRLISQTSGSYFLVLGYGPGEVVYFGLTPSQLDGSPELRKARAIAESARPTVIVESQDFLIGALVAPENSGVPTVRVEMSAEDEYEVLYSLYGRQDASFYLAVREYWKAVESGEVEREDADLFVWSLKSSLGLSWPGETMASFDKLWKTHGPGLKDWRYGSSRILELANDRGVLGMMASFQADVYEWHLLRVIAKLVLEGERVVTFADPLHVARLEPVLRATLGLPASTPTFREEKDALEAYLKEKASKTQPVMKQAPPRGVTAPSQSAPVSAIK